MTRKSHLTPCFQSYIDPKTANFLRCLWKTAQEVKSSLMSVLFPFHAAFSHDLASTSAQLALLRRHGLVGRYGLLSLRQILRLWHFSLSRPCRVTGTLAGSDSLFREVTSSQSTCGPHRSPWRLYPRRRCHTTTKGSLMKYALSSSLQLPGRMTIKVSSTKWVHRSISWRESHELLQRYPERKSHGAAHEDLAGTETDSDLNAMLYYHRIGTNQCKVISHMFGETELTKRPISGGRPRFHGRSQS